MNEVKELVEELRNKKSRDNRELLDRSADMIEKLAKELCEKSGCHHKCRDTKDCIVEEEAELLINQNKSNNFEVKSNNELFKQALVEGLNRRIDKTIEEEKQIEQIEEMARTLKDYTKKNNIMASVVILESYAEVLYNAGYRKQSVGEWISNRQTDELICSLCGAIAPVDCEKERFYKSNYCPECGAKMKGGEE